MDAVTLGAEKVAAGRDRILSELRKIIDEAVERKLAAPLPAGAATG